MRASIPKQFQMGPHTIKVRIVSATEMAAICKKHGDVFDEPAMGYCLLEQNEIFVRRACKTVPRTLQLHAFWHEYFHILLKRAGRDRLTMDETLVDTLGGLQLQAFQSAKY